MYKKNKSPKKKSSQPTLSELINKAIKVSGEDKVFSTLGACCGQFNDATALQEYASNIPEDDRSARGRLVNCLKKLGKEPRVNRYAEFSKVNETCEAS